MKLKISSIEETTFTVREKLDTEYLTELKTSLNEDGQWDSVLVRHTQDGKYELIAGHNRVQAAKELGWTEVDATVKDVNDVDAMFLSLKTNLIRQDMTEREQGKVLHEITETYNISGRELSKKIGKSKDWVNRRIKLALDLDPVVAKALEEGTITMRIAEMIAGVTPQEPFLKYVLENNITTEEDVRRAKKHFLNTTIYTIGYEGKDIQTFLELLKNNGIEHVIDVRFSAESQYKPDFSKAILSRELERAKIGYKHRPELGIPFEWQTPYKDHAVPIECLEKYYVWKMDTEVVFTDIVATIKDTGKTALLCMEKYAKPNRDQQIFCHRSILADLILKTGQFKERIDL